MKNIINTLHKIASVYEKNGDMKEANQYHNLFLKYSSDESLEDDDDIELSDPDNPPQHLIRETPVLFNSETNQPIIHEGKYLAALPNDQDLPEIRGKVREMTGIENMTIVRIPVNILKVNYVHSDSDKKELDLMQEAFESGVEDIGDFVYLLMLNETILNIEEKDLVFSSESDAYAYGGVISNYYKSKGRDMEISVAAVAVSMADTREEGMSMPEMYGDEEFIFVSNSSFQATKIPETIEDLNREFFVLSQSRGYTVDRLQREKLGDYDFDVDYDDEDGNDRFSSTLNKIHKLASRLEDINMSEEANILSDLFTRIAKKKSKKKSSGKNVPNNPSLWAECQAWAKRTYDTHPSAYSNAGAARRYRQKGGTWRKAK